MDFEFDPVKSVANKAKHGIDFEEAQGLWSDPWVIEVAARTDDELRFLAIGMLGGKHWSAIFTHREERIRLISVRRSRPKEVDRYESP